MKIPNVASTFKPISNAAAWAIIGEVFGKLIGPLIPNHIISPISIGHGFGAIAALLSSSGAFKKYKSKQGKDFDSQLLDIEKLFLENRITEEERIKLREECFNGFKKKLGK
jgi:hypothetical protein